MKLGIGLVLFLAVALSVLAEGEKTVGGLKGGRLLGNTAPQAEFWINAERKVEITFYGEDKKPVAAGGQVVVVTAEAPTGKVKMALENKDGTLISTEALPAGEDYQVVVQIRETAEAKSQNFRVTLAMGHCGECHRVEYACTCDHSE